MLRPFAAGLALFVLAAMPSRAADAAPPPAVHLTPAPGVSFDLQKGWIACDDANNKLLGEAADPRLIKAAVCVTVPGVAYNFRAFNPQLFHTMSMLVVYHDKQDITPAELASVTPEVLTAITPSVCDAIVKPLTGDGTTVDSCRVELATFGGHQSLHSIVVAAAPGGQANGKFQIDTYEVPYSKGYVQVQFNALQIFQAVTLIDLKPILESFQIE